MILYYLIKYFPFLFKYIDQKKFLKYIENVTITNSYVDFYVSQTPKFLDTLYNYSLIDDKYWIDILRCICKKYYQITCFIDNLNLVNLILDNTSEFIHYHTDLLYIIIYFSNYANEKQLNNLIALYIDSGDKYIMEEESRALTALKTSCNETQLNNLTMLLELTQRNK